MHGQYNMLLTLKRQYANDSTHLPKSKKTKQRLENLLLRMDSSMSNQPDGLPFGSSGDSPLRGKIRKGLR